jgi:PKD repeat protein
VINTTGLHWTGGDPDGDTLRYDVYFGNTTPLFLLERDTFSTIANPSKLAEATAYSWQVIARDPDGAETPGPIWDFTTKLAQPSVIPLPGFTNPPTDPDGDGFYEDLNANARKDFNDVVLMFNQMQWIAANEPVSAFDFNGNGRIDFNDIVKLFGEI